MATTEQTIWNALVGAGLSSNQAAGVMGNMQNESSFNVETNAMDSNGQRAYGLISWNAGSYPNASSLVTGNEASDLTNQINYLLHDTSNIQAGLAGSSAQQVAGNFASQVEVCAGCQPGGAQYNARVANAQQILSEAQSGNWPAGGAGAATGSTTGILSNPLGSLLEPVLSWLGNTLLKQVGVPNLKDMLERLGLILLGVALVLLGLHMLGQNIVSMGSPPSGARSEPEPREPSYRATGRHGAREDLPKNAGKAGKMSTGSTEALEAVSLA